MIELGHALNLSVVAEGVETSDQLGNLQAAGCDSAQGFLFSRPEHPDVVNELVVTSPVPAKDAPKSSNGDRSAPKAARKRPAAKGARKPRPAA